MKRKILILALLVLVLFSVSCVCASDVNDTAVASEDNTGIELTTTENNLKSSVEIEQNNDANILSEDNNNAESGTYTDLQNLINNATGSLELPYNFTYNDEIDKDKFTNGVEIKKALTIDGKGYTINGNNTHRIFTVSTSGVTLTNINFVNGYDKQNYGGAVYFKNNGEITNCNFTNNNANHGGAVCFEGTGTVTDCNFANSTARFGGAIKFNKEGTVTNSNFANNTATADNGGAIYFKSSGKVEKCNFTNNQATDVDGWGGAVYFDGEGNVTDSNFIENSACIGGAIMFYYNGGNVINCNFINNKAPISDGQGGAIFINYPYSDHIITNCTFINNSAKDKGSAIYINNNKANITKNTFINNSANGVIYIYIDGVRENNINNNIFLNNEGNAIVLSRSDDNCNADYNWFGNNATNCDVAPKTKNVNINNWLFLNATNDQDNIKFFLMNYNETTTSSYDNTLLPDVDLKITATNGNVSKNTTKLDESIEFAPTQPGSGTVTASVENAAQTIEFPIKGDFDLLQELINKATSSTIDLERNYTYNEFDTITTGVLINKAITINGNGYTIDAKGKSRIFNVKASDVTIENLTITNAKNKNEHGAIYFSSSGTVSNCNFTNNTANNGGAIYFEGTGTVTDCNFENNTARFGGAIKFNKKGTVTNSNFANNTATADNGGAIYFKSSGKVEKCNFTNNQATDAVSWGGAVYFDGAGNVTDSNFIENSAYRGGAIMFYYDGGNVINCNFINNKAPISDGQGGAIFINYPYSDHTITNCTFINNSAKDKGSAIYINKNNANITKNTFINNSANGVIYIYIDGARENNINNNIFLNNEGNAIVLSNSDNDCNADYNWFGNNATNYNETPKTKNVNINNWLFLNATNDQDNIKFFLMNYNETTTSNYDNTLLPDVDLKITATNGNVSKDTVKLDESFEFAPTEKGICTVTASVEDASYTIEINNTKENPNLSVDPQEVKYSNNTMIAINYNASATGTVNITLNGKKFNYTISDAKLNTTVSLGNINVDEYEVLVEYSGDDVFSNGLAKGTLKVNKAPTEIIIAKDTLDVKVLNFTSINATLSPADAGNLTYNSTNSSVVVTLGSMIMAISKGQAIITVSFNGTDNYEAAESKNITINVSLNDVTISVDKSTLNLKVDEKHTINATITPALAKYFNMTYTSSDESVATVDENGTVTAVGNGKAIITITVGDDTIFAKTSTKVTVNVGKTPTKITAKAITTTYNVNKNLVITLKDADGKAISGAKITVKIKTSKTYTTDKNGQVKVSTKGLAAKKYTAKITFKGDSNYEKSTKNVKVTVKKAKPKIVAKKKKFKSTVKTKKYTVKLKDNKGKAIKKAKLTLKVNGKTYKAKTNKKGKATFKITKLNKVGKFKATIKYKGNKNYKAVSKKVKLTVYFKTVSKGSKDKKTVQKIQRALKNNGYYLSYKGRYLMVDGIFEIYTKKAVKEFQGDHNLKVTGKVDQKTAKKLGII